MSNRNLLLLFLALLLVFLLTKVFNGGQEKSFYAEIIKVDSSQISRIIIRAKVDDGREWVLKKAEKWQLGNGRITVPADEEAVHTLLSNLSSVKASYIAAKSKDKWNQYDLSDSLSNEIQVFKGNKILAHFWVGKYSMHPELRQLTTFFRINGKEEVFAVVGMTGLLFNQGFDSYRGKDFLQLDVHAVEGLEFSGEQVFSVHKEGHNWVLNGEIPIDSITVWNFLVNLRQMSGDEFINDFDAEKSSQRVFRSLRIKGSNMPQDIVVRCWQDSSRQKPFIMHSSQFPFSVFASDSNRLFTRVFKPVSEW